uniref:ATPase dynein-related AAA domain-containing protein n=1 Tax=Ditylenchus dipsaci TaxID=166011 RepID=A0A915CR40_9BILA
MEFLELCNREFEYLSITRDTTEADIKQRREIQGGNVFYSDLCAVNAALNGRVLVIDGVEKAERNVLPILNNLLENREMQLDDGRFLMAASKFDKLLEKHSEQQLKEWKLERVSQNFQVIAMGLAVPAFHGHTLDPPLRSRFQGRNVTHLPFETMLQLAQFSAPSVPKSQLNKLFELIYGLNSQNSKFSGAGTRSQGLEQQSQLLGKGCLPDVLSQNTILKTDTQLPVLNNYFSKFSVDSIQKDLCKVESFEVNADIGIAAVKLLLVVTSRSTRDSSVPADGHTQCWRLLFARSQRIRKISSY